MCRRRCLDQTELERAFAELRRVELEALIEQRGTDQPLRASIDNAFVKVHQAGAPSK